MGGYKMIKSLKGKITFVYLSLVLTLAIVGITSVISLYTLSKSIDGLMTDNYKSIQAVNNMLVAIEEENFSIKSYINTPNAENIDNFNKISKDYYKWYYIEKNNITEPGEGESFKKITKIYDTFLSVTSEIQETKSSTIYNERLVPVINELKYNLKDLSKINEDAMFNSKNEVKAYSQTSTYLILFLSLLFVLSGLVLSKFLTNQFLKPIYMLTETMKSVKEGSLKPNTEVILSDDEFGSMMQEFNKMTERLEQFENSSIGKVITEKNKSLAIMKSISDPLIVLDENYRIVLLNEAFEKFFNVSESKVTNKHLLEAIKNIDVYDIISQIVEKNEPSSSKVISFPVGEDNAYFNVTATLIKDNNKDMKNIVILFQNITGLKQMEKIKTDFISAISHEFKTPLTSIMMGASLLEDDNIGELNKNQTKIVNTMKEDGEKLSSLVSNLLQLSNLQSDKSIYNIQPCSILGIIDNSVKGFYEIAESKDITLHYELSDDLPRVSCDSEKIGWVLNNLVSNAIKFTDSGDDICVSAEQKDDYMFIYVKDTGIGIPEEYQKTIFNKFVQINASSRDSRGSGLGLTISKEIVNAHHANLWCESDLDVGSTFTFQLPLAK